MSLKNRLERLENSFGQDCQQHSARLWREGDPAPTCERCGALLPVVKAPAKMTRDEWVEKAADFAARKPEDSQA